MKSRNPGAGITPIQENALDQGKRLGKTFTARELMALPGVGSGKAGTDGHINSAGKISVNTVQQLIAKGALKVARPGDFFHQRLRVAELEEGRAPA